MNGTKVSGGNLNDPAKNRNNPAKHFMCLIIS